MSQQKVDQYKKEKYNRKKQIQTEKRTRLIYGTAGCVAAAALAAWIGFSTYSIIQANKPVSYTEVNIDAISDYMNTLN